MGDRRRRAPCGRADRDRALSERSAGIDAESREPRSGRFAFARGKRRQQHRSRCRRLEGGQQSRGRIRSDGLVSDSGHLQPRRFEDLRAERERTHVAGESSLHAAGAALRRAAVHRCNPHGNCIDRADSESRGPRDADEDGLQPHEVHRRESPRTRRRAGRLSHSAARRRSVADQARLLCDS